MPKRKRVQREHTEDWKTIQQYKLWQDKEAYELLRPVVLFGDPAIQRAKETGEPRLPWNAKPMLLTSRAWSACLHPGPANSPRKRRGAYHQICGS